MRSGGEQCEAHKSTADEGKLYRFLLIVRQVERSSRRATVDELDAKHLEVGEFDIGLDRETTAWSRAGSVIRSRVRLSISSAYELVSERAIDLHPPWQMHRVPAEREGQERRS